MEFILVFLIAGGIIWALLSAANARNREHGHGGCCGGGCGSSTDSTSSCSSDSSGCDGGGGD